MNEKIGLPDLTRAIAKECGLDTKVCDSFLRALFTTIGQALVEGESVKVKGIGTFKSTDVEQRKSVNVNTGQEMLIPGHRKVSFTPDKALAEAVNAPFAMFEPVELADDMTEQMLAAAETDTEPDAAKMTSAVKPQPPAPEPFAEVVAGPAPALEMEAEAETETSPTTQPQLAPEPAQEPENASGPPVGNPDDSTPKAKSETALSPKGYTGEPYIYEPEIEYRHRSHFGRGFIIGVLCTAIVAVCALVAWRLISPASLAHVTEGLAGTTANQATPLAAQNTPAATSTITNNTHVPRTSDTVSPISPVKGGEKADVPTTASDQQANAPDRATPADRAKDKSATAEKPVPKAYTDKITKRRYLTTMAREYYGNYHLWPYIYDYNKGLGHPDRIRPGTKIKVPTAETLGIDPTDPAVIRKAKARGIEIYKRYR